MNTVQNKLVRLFLIVSLLAGIGAAAHADNPNLGTLVIAGGAVSDDNSELFETFLDAMPNRDNGNIAILTTASGSPVESAEHMRQVFQRYGIDANRIFHVRVAVRDDDSTPKVDESRWAKNVDDGFEIAKIRKADAIWLAGGDQSRYMQVLANDEGLPGNMLAEIFNRLYSGAVVGGTSAGAAVMSDPMITSGGSMGALLGPSGDEESDSHGDLWAGEGLTTNHGFGLFQYGLVDQHFGERARLGRLAVALQRMAKPQRMGFGIDEDTALVMNLANHSLSVVGAGNVTLLWARDAEWRRDGGRLAITGMSVSVLSSGDRLSFTDGVVQPSDYKKPTVGDEYNSYNPGAGGGMAMPSESLARTLGSELLDNDKAETLERYSFETGSVPKSIREGTGVLYRFTQQPESKGYWGRDAAGKSRYTVVAVGFDIIPVNVRIDTIGQELK